MKTQSIYLILLVICFWVSSCKKNYPSTHTTIDGYVVERGTGKPIIGAQAILVKNTGGIGTNNLEVIGTTQADLNGYYSFTFDADDHSGYGVEAKDSRYEDWSYPYISITTGVANHKNITLYPPAWLKTHIINPYSHVVLLGYSSTGIVGNADTTIIDKVDGNGNFEIIYWVDKSGDANRTISNIYCKGFDTTLYTINIPK